MNDRITLQPSVVLHTRPFRSSSLIVDLFSEQHGRVSVVANSARGPRSRFKGVLQPFRPLLCSWSGKRELKSLNGVELSGLPFMLSGIRLFCGYYLNELLVNLLAKDDAHDVLYSAYLSALQGLANQQSNLELSLRRFEKTLLTELGYGVQFDCQAGSMQPIEAGGFYALIADRGFLPVTAEQAHQSMVFSGESLLAIAADRYDSAGILEDAKKIMRYLIAEQLGAGKKIHSRELIKALL